MMRCECCGREEDVLIEIGAVSPKVSVTGRCCAECCAFILRALEDRREEQPAERAEMVPVQDGQVFVDEDGYEISIIGMKLIQRLEKLETDDDDFPEYQIGMIRDLIGEA